VSSLQDLDTGSSEGLEPRLAGGAVAAYLPYVVALRSGGALVCGASLIAPRFVLTAAQCVAGKSPSSFTVVVGRPNLADKTYGTDMRYTGRAMCCQLET
jgi:secreted trypsin-like serine protease